MMPICHLHADYDWLNLSDSRSIYSDTGNDKVLNQVRLPIVDKNTCNSRSYYDGRITSAMICAGYAEGGRDACQVRSHLRTSMSDVKRNYFRFGQRQFRVTSYIDVLRFEHNIILLKGFFPVPSAFNIVACT